MSDDQIHLFEDFTLDLRRGSLVRGDELVHLRPQTYQVLMYLVQNRGQLISKDKLIEDVWQGRAVTDGSLGKCIEELRGALGDTSMTCIRNVHGRGYTFDVEANHGSGIRTTSEQIDVVKVVVVDEEKDPGVALIGGRIRKQKWGIVAALALTALLVVGLGYWFFRRAPVSPQIKTVAVLRFVNESGDPNTEYLADGISESLINNLSRLPALKVIARSSSFNYKSNAFDPQQVASELAVQGIVTGRISRAGDNLLISVELMDARNKAQVWGEQYNRRGSDLALVQTEISKEIARNLRLRLSEGEQQRLNLNNQVNPQAYDLLIRGRFFWRKEGAENFKKGVEYFREAIAVDPNYALAYAQLAVGYEYLYSASYLHPGEYGPKAEAAAQRALELDEGLADAHYAAANQRRNAWDWAAAEREYQRAIELNPNLAEAHFFYSYYLMDVGRNQEAFIEAQRARELDPLSLSKSEQVASMLLVSRRYDEATAVLQKIVSMDPNFAMAHFWYGTMYMMKGMYPEAVKSYQETIRLGNNSASPQIYLAAAYAKAGDRQKALQMLRRLEKSADYVSPAELAVLYTALDQRDQAIASLEKAYSAHDLQLQFLKADNSFDVLRDDPRFKDLVRRVGLPA